MKHKLAAVALVLGSMVWGCGTAERPKGSGGTGGAVEGGSGGSGGSPGGSGGSSNPGGGTGGHVGSGGSGGSMTTGGSGGAKAGDASADSAPSSSDGPMMSGGDLWAKCGPEAFKANVSAAVNTVANAGRTEFAGCEAVEAAGAAESAAKAGSVAARPAARVNASTARELEALMSVPGKRCAERGNEDQRMHAGGAPGASRKVCHCPQNADRGANADLRGEKTPARGSPAR